MARIGTPTNRNRNILGVIAAGAIVGGAVVSLPEQVAPPAPPMAAQATADAPIFANGFEGGGGGGAPIPEPTACPAPPAGFREAPMVWGTPQRGQESFSAWGYPCGRLERCERNPQDYPGWPSYAAPIGADKGEYHAVEFTAGAGYVNISFDAVQPIAHIGYNPSRPAFGMLFSVSRCRGDLTASVMGPNCSIYEQSGGMGWTTNPAYKNFCQLTQGERYYLHVTPADPAGGLTPGEHSCQDVSGSRAGCDVGARIQTGR